VKTWPYLYDDICCDENSEESFFQIHNEEMNYLTQLKKDKKILSMTRLQMYVVRLAENIEYWHI